MREYFKHCSVQELKQEINNRFAVAKIKIHQMKNRSPRGQLVDRKFYDYVSEIKTKQRQYQTILNEPSELNYLLKKRRNRINESLEKYERNVKCKTMSDFKVTDYGAFHPLQSSAPIPLDNRIINSEFKPKRQHTLLEKASKNEINPRSKTEANFFTLKQEQMDFKTQKDSQGRNLRSITNVVNITVNSSLKPQQKQQPIFSFAKAKTTQKKLKEKELNAAKKAIRFDTAPSQIWNIQSQSERKAEISSEAKLGKLSVQQNCIKSTYFQTKKQSNGSILTLINVNRSELLPKNCIRNTKVNPQAEECLNSSQSHLLPTCDKFDLSIVEYSSGTHNQLIYVNFQQGR